jgi:hypothetical protein
MEKLTAFVILAIVAAVVYVVQTTVSYVPPATNSYQVATHEESEDKASLEIDNDGIKVQVPFPDASDLIGK